MSNEKTPVIIVTEMSGRERRYAAGYWDGTGQHLSVRTEEDGDAVALYAPGAWLSAREDGSEVPDGNARALGIAKRTLSEIVRRAGDGGEQPFGRPEIAALASTALNDIFTETEL